MQVSPYLHFLNFLININEKHDDFCECMVNCSRKQEIQDFADAPVWQLNVWRVLIMKGEVQK